jgi:F-type H+-transporting ATPase subunit beta
LTKYEELRKIVMVIGFDELSKADRILFERAQKILNFLTQPFFVAEIYTGKPGQYVPLEHTLEICEKILSGRFDRMPVQDFYMVGCFEEKR